MYKKNIESSIIEIVSGRPNGIPPIQLRTTLENKGIDGNDIRDAIARLIDSGTIYVDSNLNILIRSI